MPKISELSDPGSGYNVTGGELVVVTTQGLSSIALSASDLVNRTADTITTGTLANLKATHTDFNANSAAYDSAYSTVNANSARNARTALSVETNVVPNSASWTTGYNSTQTELKSNSASWTTGYNSTQTELKSNSASWTTGYNSTQTELKSNSASWNYVAANSATLQSDTTVSGALSGNSTLIINGRGTFGGDHIVTDNILTVFGNISAQGTIYASGSALGDVDPINPGGSNRTIQYNDSNAFGGAAQFAYDEVNHNVGIGTQAIAIADNIHEKLTVAGNISATGKIYNEDGELGSVSPGGADGAIQFNNSSTLSGNANLSFDDTNDILLLSGDTNPFLLVTDTTNTVRGFVGADDTTGFLGSYSNHPLSIRTNNTEQMRIATSGNVSTNVRLGIGTASPSSTLDVTETTNDGNTLVQLTQAGTGRGLGVNRNVASATRQMVSFAQLHSSGGSQPVVHIQQADSDEIALGVDTAGTTSAPTFSVRGDGTVGINTSDPDHKLHIVGSSGTSNMVRLSCGPTASSGTLINAHQNTNSDGIVVDSTGTGSPLITKKSGTTTFIVSGTGHVGIGTDTPGRTLDVHGDFEVHNSGGGANAYIHGGTAGADARISFVENGTTKSAIYHDASNDSLVLQDGANTDTVNIKGAKVGIGTDNPAAKLHVNAGTLAVSGANAALEVHNTTGNTLITFKSAHDPSLELRANQTGFTFQNAATDAGILRLNENGNVGIGGGDVEPGYKLHVVESNTSTVAISAFGEIHAGGDIVSSSSSDRRQKTNIKKLDNALDKVLTLDGVEYDWNEMAAAHRIGKHDVGVIAQQVEEVLPDAVEHRETGMMAVRYERLVPLLIEAIKELKSEIDELKGK